MVRGQWSIVFDGEENAQLRIIDSRGQIWKTYEVDPDMETYVVDLSGLPTGLYFAAFQSNELELSVQRFSVVK